MWKGSCAQKQRQLLRLFKGLGCGQQRRGRRRRRCRSKAGAEHDSIDRIVSGGYIADDRLAHKSLSCVSSVELFSCHSQTDDVLKLGTSRDSIAQTAGENDRVLIRAYDGMTLANDYCDVASLSFSLRQGVYGAALKGEPGLSRSRFDYDKWLVDVDFANLCNAFSLFRIPWVVIRTRISVEDGSVSRERQKRVAAHRLGLAVSQMKRSLSDANKVTCRRKDRTKPVGGGLAGRGDAVNAARVKRKDLRRQANLCYRRMVAAPRLSEEGKDEVELARHGRHERLVCVSAFAETIPSIVSPLPVKKNKLRRRKQSRSAEIDIRSVALSRNDVGGDSNAPAGQPWLLDSDENCLSAVDFRSGEHGCIVDASSLVAAAGSCCQEVEDEIGVLEATRVVSAGANLEGDLRNASACDLSSPGGQSRLVDEQTVDADPDVCPQETP